MIIEFAALYSITAVLHVIVVYIVNYMSLLNRHFIVEKPKYLMQNNLHYTGLHRSVAVFIPPDSVLFYTLRHSNSVCSAECKQ